MRISPRRELGIENQKRGCSLESGIIYEEKDDDLALFNEILNKERENFLLQSNDFDDFSTKLGDFSDHKLRISIPARGDGRDLLKAEGDKNDHDWLITPPETPLFPSLDDETPPTNLARGRPRSEPLSISRSSTMENSERNSRSSASPHRLTPSARSGNNNTLQSRSRPSSAPRASKPSTPSLRFNSPIPGRTSTSLVAPSRVRGTSPVKMSKPYSASPNLGTWQSHICDFSSEAPPNLRTSLADRPALYVRGSSPAPRKGSKSVRQSMSPTASRSASSSHSRSRGSIASSGDDDLDSPQSISMNSLDRSTSKGINAFRNNRGRGFSKKQYRVLSSSSAPKRSFDMALQQMDRRKGPQNMFRPLLSSVPSSTFCAGKANAAYRSITTRISSVTTSNSLRLDQVTSDVQDREISDQNPQDMVSEHAEGQYSEAADEIFEFDQSDALNEDVDDASNEDFEYNALEKSPSNVDSKFDGHSIVDVTESYSGVDSATAIATASVVTETRGGHSDTDNLEDTMFCSKCGHMFHSAELVKDADLQLCLKCKNLEVMSSISTQPVSAMISENTSRDHVQILEHGPLEALSSSTADTESLPATRIGKAVAKQLICSYSEPTKNFSTTISLSPVLVEEGQLNITPASQNDRSINENSCNQLLRQFSSSKVDIPDVAGISLLLKKSISSQGHIQSRSFTTCNISYDNSFRDSLNSTRSSIGHSSASVSSSVDLRSLRQIETCEQRVNDGKSDMENYRFEILTKHKCSLSLLSGASSHAFQVPSVATNSYDDGFEVVPSSVENDVREAAWSHLLECSLASEFTEVPSNGDIFSQDSHCEVDSTNSKNGMNDLMQPSVLEASNDNTIASIEEPDISDAGQSTLDESTVTPCLTLEEATDTTLFCSSIVHSLAYEAANIAIEKANSTMERSQPTVLLVGKSNPDRRDVHTRANGKRTSKSQKAQLKRLETDTKPPHANGGEDKKTDISTRRVKPLKVESKCNCTIM